MATNKDDIRLVQGIGIFFDGKKNNMILPNLSGEYRIGAMICEYLRLAPTKLKDIILSCDGLNEKETADSFIKTFVEFHEKLFEEFPCVTAAMIEIEFMNVLDDWFKAVRENKVEEIKKSLHESSNEKIDEFIFKDTGFSDYGNDTVLQLLLTCYSGFATNYVLTKGLFIKLYELGVGNEQEHVEGVDLLIDMYSKYIDIQHIDYRIVVTNNGLESLYTVKSSLSLLMFEVAHCIQSNVKISKCKNCGNYFIPERRSDEVYCAYPLRDDKTKTCKDVGAQVTRANKEKNDAATKKYRQMYMRYKMATKRHPDDSVVAERFEELTKEAKEWRNKISHGNATAEDFIKWLEGFEEVS